MHRSGTHFVVAHSRSLSWDVTRRRRPSCSCSGLPVSPSLSPLPSSLPSLDLKLALYNTGSTPCAELVTIGESLLSREDQEKAVYETLNLCRMPGSDSLIIWYVLSFFGIIRLMSL